jgi:hypothetical protein
VIADIESGRFRTILQAREHYGISGADTIPKWLVKYGRNHLCSKVIRVQKPNEKDEIRQLKKQIRQLKEALGQTQAENVLNQAYFKLLCEDTGVEPEEIKKKAGIGQFTKDQRDQK